MNFVKTNIDHYYKDKNTGFIINNDEIGLLLYKNQIKDHLKTQELNETVKKLESTINILLEKLNVTNNSTT